MYSHKAHLFLIQKHINIVLRPSEKQSLLLTCVPLHSFCQNWNIMLKIVMRSCSMYIILLTFLYQVKLQWFITPFLLKTQRCLWPRNRKQVPQQNRDSRLNPNDKKYPLDYLYLLNGLLNKHVTNRHQNTSKHSQHCADDSTSDEPTVSITAHFLYRGNRTVQHLLLPNSWLCLDGFKRPGFSLRNRS